MLINNNAHVFIIAMGFATWISPEFQLYIMKDYRRLKTDESSKFSLNWNFNREISKLNYRVHTDAIRDNLIQGERLLLLREMVNPQLRTFASKDFTLPSSTIE